MRAVIDADRAEEQKRERKRRADCKAREWKVRRFTEVERKEKVNKREDSEVMGGPGKVSCPQGGGGAHDQWKGGAKGGGGSLDTLPPIPPGTGLSNPPQNPSNGENLVEN